MLESDEIWQSTMSEAAAVKSPNALRQLFITLLLYCEVSLPINLWNQFSKEMAEDFLGSSDIIAFQEIQMREGRKMSFGTPESP